MVRSCTSWSQSEWQGLEVIGQARSRQAADDADAWVGLTRMCRRVLRTYSTSFYIVTRFLPPHKRSQVEAVYAAVRYPDEVVDTFDLSAAQRHALLDAWLLCYERGIQTCSLRETVAEGTPVFLAPFTQVVRSAGIPSDYYRAFLDAMRLDVSPRSFVDVNDLIDSYVYGSAIVVGYFLTYVYGSAHPRDFDRALGSARNLGIALQLTNFLRDVREDQRRGRQYLPNDMLQAQGIGRVDASDPKQHAALNVVVRQMAAIASEHYALAERDIDAFAPDCRQAIQACQRVYGELNARVAANPDAIAHRESVPFMAKFRLLPASKYWRLPLAYLGD